MALLKVQFDYQKGVIIPVFVATAEDTVKIENEKDKEKYIKTLPKFDCLIDTGAGISCISENLSKALELEPSGGIPMHTASGSVEVDVYSVTLIIPMEDSFRIFADTEVAEYQNGTDRHDVLLGRDILREGLLQMGWGGQAFLSF